jgi:hypothetical protein
LIFCTKKNLATLLATMDPGNLRQQQKARNCDLVDGRGLLLGSDEEAGSGIEDGLAASDARDGRVHADLDSKSQIFFGSAENGNFRGITAK